MTEENPYLPHWTKVQYLLFLDPYKLHSKWYKGFQLSLVYVMIGILFYFLTEAKH